MALKYFIVFLLASQINGKRRNPRATTHASDDCEILYTKESAQYWSARGFQIPEQCIDEEEGPIIMSRAASYSVPTRTREPVKDADGNTRYNIRYSLEGFSEKEIDIVQRSLQDLSDDVCLNFVEVVPTSEEPNREPKDVIRIIGPADGNRGCNAHISPRSDRKDNPLNLGRGCVEMSLVQHEMMHSIGFGHEHARPDRDDVVVIQDEVMVDGILTKDYPYGSAYKGKSTKNCDGTPYDGTPCDGTPYDMESVMHYPVGSEDNPKITLRAKDSANRWNNDSGKIYYKRPRTANSASSMDRYAICKKFGCSKCVGQKIESYEPKGHQKVMLRCNGTTTDQYCWPERCAAECQIVKSDEDDWYLPKQDIRCTKTHWANKCNYKRGRCNFCETDTDGGKGYCCRVGKDGCPADAVKFLATYQSQFIKAKNYEVCVQSTNVTARHDWHVIDELKTWHGEADVASYRYTLIDGCTPTEKSFNAGECYEDSQKRILPVHKGKYDDNQSSRCIAACKGFKYAGMQNTNGCYCGNILPTATLQRPGECRKICPGNANEKCGGRWRMNVYEVTGDRGVVIDFVSPVQYMDVLLHTRVASRHRYKNVCLYADEVRVGCTPADLTEAPPVINFKDYTNSESPVIASKYRIMFENDDNKICSQIEEIFVQYLDVRDNFSITDKTTTTVTPKTTTTTASDVFESRSGIRSMWHLPEQQDCWTRCKHRGGKCEWCGQNGYCCSGKKLHLNGDCPSDGVTYIGTQTSTKGHVCVAYRNEMNSITTSKMTAEGTTEVPTTTTYYTVGI